MNRNCTVWYFNKRVPTELGSLRCLLFAFLWRLGGLLFFNTLQVTQEAERGPWHQEGALGNPGGDSRNHLSQKSGFSMSSQASTNTA